MGFATSSVTSDERVFRLAYASRAQIDMPRKTAVDLAADAARINVHNKVTGVLFSGDGIFLQWLEGPGEDVHATMSRIEADPRHKDVTVLGAGWMPHRRYPLWPMRLADHELPIYAPPRHRRSSGTSPYDSAQAMSAFDSIADAYRRQTEQAETAPHLYIDFADRLIFSKTHEANPPQSAMANLQARAQFVDDVSAAFMSGWKDDLWNSVQVSIGMSYLRGLWQQYGRVPDPLRARRRAAVVVPPGSTEILGAIVKTDLLRADGISVLPVFAQSEDDAIRALKNQNLDALIVAGSRVGWSSENMRAERLADTLRETFEGRPVFIGGRGFGSLCDWSERLAFRDHAASALSNKEVEWLARESLATLAAKRRGVSVRHPDGQKQTLN